MLGLLEENLNLKKGLIVFIPLFSMVFFCQAMAMDTYDGKTLPSLSNQTPKQLEGVGIDQKLGSKIDLELSFKNELGESVKLGSFYQSHKPVIISLVYFNCPSLCNFHLNGMTEVLKGVDWNPGDKFEVLAISFDSKETPEMAKNKKKTYMEIYNRPNAEKGWHFLTADQTTLDKLTNSVGFKYKWNEKENEWSHASAAIVTTSEGIISRYLGGIQFEAKDIKLALNEAADGKIGSLIDKVILFCFHYDPQANKYALYAFNLVRLGGALIVLLMVLWLLPFWLRIKKNESTVRS